MLRSLTLQPLSLVIGVAFSGLVLLSMSQAPALNANTIGIQYLPHPRDMVQIRGSVPYTVPPGKLFVLTALRNADGSGGPQLRIDGQPDLSTSPITAQCGGPSIEPITLGLTIPPGSVVTLAALGGSGDANCRAYGYLVAQ
jgi:hypothetical protein